MKHNFSASNIPTIPSKAYQNTTKVYQFDKMAFHLFLKSFLVPPCLNSRVFIVSVSPMLPQTCCQDAKGPLGSSASACSWTCLIPTHSPSHLQPSSFPPWWGLWDSTLPPRPQRAPQAITDLQPLPQWTTPLAAPWCLCPWQPCLNPVQRHVSKNKYLLLKWPLLSMKDSRELQCHFRALRNLAKHQCFGLLTQDIPLVSQGKRGKTKTLPAVIYWDTWQQAYSSFGISAYIELLHPFF